MEIYCCFWAKKCWMYVIVIICVALTSCFCELDDDRPSTYQRFQLEGKVTVQGASEEWMSHIRILVDGGHYLGLLKSDGSFSISVPSGSYIVEATHPTYVFDPARVEINSKGKIRARVVNNIQPNSVQSLAYPLRFKSRGRAQYFERREQWRITDFLFSPMVYCVIIFICGLMIMMMFLPLMLMFLLPKLINTQDPETQREMQQSMNMLQPQQNLPDAAEMLTKWFGGGTASSSTSGSDTGRRATARSRPARKQ